MAGSFWCRGVQHGKTSKAILRIQISSRKFDDTFKGEAVQNWLSSDKSAELIGEELGLNANLLYARRKRFALSGTGGRGPQEAKPGSSADLQSQLDDTRRELA